MGNLLCSVNFDILHLLEQYQRNKNVELKILLQEAYGNQLSLRKLSLIDDHNQEGVTDISIRFFGIEWPVVLKRWNCVEKKTRSVVLY